MIPALSEPERRVFSAIYTFPGLSVSRTAQVASVSLPATQRAVRRLECLRLIRTSRPNLARLCRPAEWVLA